MTQLFVKKLTNIDFSFLDAKRGLVGESWLIDIELSGELDEQGMVVDFGIVKRVVRDFIDEFIDHCLVVPTLSNGCVIKDVIKDKQAADSIEIDFPLENGLSIHHRSPAQAVCLVNTKAINKTSIREYLLVELQKRLPANVTGLKVRLYGEPHLREYYQYSHGLSQHQGNCQRIAHGHRSGLNIKIEGEPNEQWRDHWIDRWQDIYIGCPSHLIDSEFMDDGDALNYHHFRYQAPQGEFYLRLPKEMCYLIDSASTVENIAQHLLDEMIIELPNQKIEIQAFEGIGKGAIVST